ncbi:manganese transporter Smf2p [Diutina catenulata]
MPEWLHRVAAVGRKYAKFIGPGLMVSVAYMDPGNYSTAVAAGAAYKYNLLFSIFVSNCLAIFLQILAAKLGCVTGLDLAANCKAHFAFSTNVVLYVLTEIAIIATDLAEVVGTAIALNILFNMPLWLGVVVTVIDVLVVLAAYRPKGPLMFIRIFESFVTILVAATVVCFGIELYQVSHDSEIAYSSWEVFKGFLPSPAVVDMNGKGGANSSGLYLSLAILGATVMPHSLYLGSGLVQARLKDFDIKHGHYESSACSRGPAPDEPDPEPSPAVGPSMGPASDTSTIADDDDDGYRPSVHAINATMHYTIWELVVSLFTVALFVNSAILIVAGATLGADNTQRDPWAQAVVPRDDDDDDSDSDSDHEDYSNADLFTIYNLLTKHLSPTAGFVFALALLCSGQSAGVVCTLAGQMVSEGYLNWSFPPVTRRLITRALAIAPCLVVVTMSGREGLSSILNGSQVVLSLLLPVVTAPLIYFTCSKHIMRVPIMVRDGDEPRVQPEGRVRSDSMTHPFKASPSAIKLQDLRNSHPCGNFDDDETDTEWQQRQRLIDAPVSAQPSASTLVPPEPSPFTDPEDGFRCTGYQDYANSAWVAVLAVVVWGFITVLNLYLIVAFGFS